MLTIRDLHAKVEDKEVLKGINLSIKPGEVHAIMGPNGGGKSSLSKVLAGHPEYEVTAGELIFEVNFRAKDILALEPEERSQMGLFLAFQYPVEIPGVPNIEFLRAAMNAHCKYQGVPELGEEAFRSLVNERAAQLDIDPSFLDRELNVDLSGGEKKRNEVLQMAVLAPKLAVLDEIDSGLDVDSLRIVSEGVNHIRKEYESSVLLITHYDRILSYINPDFVHVLYDGKIIKSGDRQLAGEIESRGYDWLIKG